MDNASSALIEFRGEVFNESTKALRIPLNDFARRVNLALASVPRLQFVTLSVRTDAVLANTVPVKFTFTAFQPIGAFLLQAATVAGAACSTAPAIYCRPTDSGEMEIQKF